MAPALSEGATSNSRSTRSSARLHAQRNNTSQPATDNPPDTAEAHPPRPPPASKKRKAAAEPSPTHEAPPSRRSKRAKGASTEQEQEQPESPTSASSSKGRKGAAAAAAMSSAGYGGAPADEHASAKQNSPSSGTSGETSPQHVPKDSTRRKSGRKKTKEGPSSENHRKAAVIDLPADPSTSAAPSGSARRAKRGSLRKGQDVSMKDVEEKQDEQMNAEPEEEAPKPESADAVAGGDDAPRRYTEEELDAMEREDPFTAGYLGRLAGGHSGLSSSLRALSGIMSGTSSRLRSILEQLRMKEDPSIQLIALQELSELLLVSNEDNLAGHFAPDQYVKELVTLMQPNEFTAEENPEIMLLACRCIANLMEALPAATASVVYGGAVPILCQKLLEIHFIDLAEQALSTLEKISVEFPSSIVREGGLTACLTYLDFFATSTQRTAVTTAANCCRNIPEESFPVVRDVMPILLTTLGSSDQKVVEQASICVSRVIDSFKYQESKLEELVSPDLLKAIQRLLLPGSTNLIGPNIHTQFLRVLAITARASPRLSVELLKMNVVDTLYQILTGVSPPLGTDDIASKIDKNIIMQAIIRTSREQIFETLNVICELLPNVSLDGLTFLDDLHDAGYTGPASVSMSTRSKTSPNDKRVELLEGCKDEVKRFAVVLFPTLMHAYTSTVNLSVRQKVLTAQLKMLSNFDTNILEDSLRGVSYASHLASILSQQENPALVTFALQAGELLLKRLEAIYRPQFYREGVMAEIEKLSKRPMKTEPSASQEKALEVEIMPKEEEHIDDEDPSDDEDEPDHIEVDVVGDNDSDNDEENQDEEQHTEEVHIQEHNDDEDKDDDEEDDDDDEAARPDHPRPITDLQDIITLRAKRFMEAHGNEGGEAMQTKAANVLNDLQRLARDLQSCYSTPKSSNGTALFRYLSKYFDGDALASITSYELLTSGIVETLLSIFTDSDPDIARDARADFLEVFMSASNQAKPATGSVQSPPTAFSVLVHKLQDLLSRAEHFEVITVHHNAFESNRSGAASMLAKQLRLRLVADEDSGIPRAYRNIMVSIHAIATFKALDDYLRPRISLAERPRSERDRRGLSSAMAAYAAVMAGRGGRDLVPPPTLPGLASSLPSRATPTSKKSSRGKPSKSEQVATTPAVEPTSRLRRSSRRRSGQNSSLVPPPPAHEAPTAPAPSSDEVQDPLECADEAQISSDDEDDVEAELDALVGDLAEGALDHDVPDPSAVSLEIANTGKVTARTEEGERVSTPSQSGPGASARDQRLTAAAARLSAAREMLGGPPSSSRHMSYASVLQAVPQDWHIEFSVNDQPIANDVTIYRACHFNPSQSDEVSSRNIWSATHTIKFKRVSGPPLAESSSLTPPPDLTLLAETGMPPSLDRHPVTSGILRLMSIMHELNANLDDVLAENKAAVNVNAEPLAQFVNTKLTAKLNRQLEEPLVVASNCLPSWAEDLARLYPFLFPFETRHLFLQSTSFGYSRSMSRWQNAHSENESSHHRRHRDERPFLGRLQRQKVRISRSRILESAIKVMELYGSSPSVLEVEYFEEVGTGLGPTLEFYSTVSKELSKKKTKLWRENESYDGDDYAFGKRGLFPAPMSESMASNDNGKRVLHLFKMLGKFVARSMLDSRIIDVSFNPTFFRIGDGSAAVTPSLGAVASVDQDLAKSLKMLKKYATAKQRIDEDCRLTAVQKARKANEVLINDARVDDLGLDFSLPGYPNIELQPDGSNTAVTIDNVGQYVDKVIEFTLSTGVQKQADAFRAGFSQVFPYSALKAFTPDELVMLFGRSEEDWSLETLMDSIKADHGYNLDSKSVRNLLQTMSELGPPQKRDFLQFVTGSPKLPIGGFKALTPMFTVVCKPSEPPYSSDDYLPSVMTCVNYLKMPDYSSLDVLKERVGVAIKEGQGAFHLS